MISIEEEKNNMNIIQNSLLETILPLEQCLLGTVFCTVGSLSKTGDDLHHMGIIFVDFQRFSSPICTNSAMFGPDFGQFLAIFGAENSQIARENLYQFL